MASLPLPGESLSTLRPESPGRHPSNPDLQFSPVVFLTVPLNLDFSTHLTQVNPHFVQESPPSPPTSAVCMHTHVWIRLSPAWWPLASDWFSNGHGTQDYQGEKGSVSLRGCGGLWNELAFLSDWDANAWNLCSWGSTGVLSGSTVDTPGVAYACSWETTPPSLTPGLSRGFVLFAAMCKYIPPTHYSYPWRLR
jgi:hypothetical protein